MNKASRWLGSFVAVSLFIAPGIFPHELSQKEVKEHD
jgi:hypothetical protein